MTKTYELDELVFNGQWIAAVADVEFDTDATPCDVYVQSITDWTNDDARDVEVTPAWDKKLAPYFIDEAMDDESAPTVDEIKTDIIERRHPEGI